MLSQTPINLTKVEKGDIDKEILRTAIIAELDAITLYEQMAHTTQNDNLKTVLMDIAREEKTHVGEFQAMLLKLDREQEKELANGHDEIDELLEG
jgi:rubrerythrin